MIYLNCFVIWDVSLLFWINYINPSEDISPDSLAEATTAPLDDDALGGTATQDDVKK